MGIFGASSIYDADVEKATSEKNTTDKWDLIMEICDKVGNNTANAKECLRSVMRRLNHNDPHVVMRAITLLDACVNNCGKSFHLEVASREFETEFKRILAKNLAPDVNTKLKLCLKKWAEGDFKADPQLNLIPSLYQKLKSEGHDFSEPHQHIKKEIPLSKDPNVVSSQQEEDDIAKAIELSLKEAQSSPKTSYKTASNSNNQISSLYPSMSLGGSAAAGGSNAAAPEPRKVRALYDFEAAEDNELTFFAGETLLVIDDSDPNWWKGQNKRGEGLFPSNFVTADLSAEPEDVKIEKTKKAVQFSDEQSDNTSNERKEEVVQINEDTIDRLLHLLHEADPEDPSQDTDDMLRLEHQVNQMTPLIDNELERVDRKHAQLTQLSSDLAEAVALYHQLMRDDRNYAGGFMQPGVPPHMMYNNMSGSPMSLPGMYNPYQMGNMPPSSMPHSHQMMPPVSQQQGPQDYMAVPSNYMAPGMQGAFHVSVPQQLQNGHQPPNLMANGNQNSNNYMQQPQSIQNQMPQNNQPQFTQSSPNHQQPYIPQQPTQTPQPNQYNLPPAVNPNEPQSSPSHQMHQNIQQQQPPHMHMPGQTMIPPAPHGMIPQQMMYNNPHQSPQAPQNIPIYQQQR